VQLIVFKKLLMRAMTAMMTIETLNVFETHSIQIPSPAPLHQQMPGDAVLVSITCIKALENFQATYSANISKHSLDISR